jgi:oligopeptide transport system ATP-binding protein
MPILSVSDLRVSFGNSDILRGVSLDVEPGQTIGLVGESGCGKTMLGLSLMGMIPHGGRISGGSIILEGKDLTKISEKEYRSLRGSDLAMVMQDPFTSLNPVMRIGDQVAESLVLHQNKSWSEARIGALEMLLEVGIPEPERAMRKYPHEMSGGQRQRVVIAIAFSCQPKVLIADEPTTALDVTLQAQVLRLLTQMQERFGTAVILISHNIGVIASVCDRVNVVYAGEFVESGTVTQVLKSPLHPYTKALLEAMPDAEKDVLFALGGQPPRLDQKIDWCAFRDRCPVRCSRADEPAPWVENDEHHGASCWNLKP